jgi:glycosyltransferase involved in cell wall biosynthesis
VDGGSTDDTLAIGKEFGARVVPQPGGAIADFALVRNIGLRAAAQPWILYLDSDEYLSPEAMEGVRQAAMTSKPVAGHGPERLERARHIDGQRTPQIKDERLLFHGGEQCFDFPVLHNLALIDDSDVPTELFSFLQIVGRQDDRHARLVQLTEEIPHSPPEFDIHPSGRFIEDEESRLMDKPAGNHEATLHPAREGPGLFMPLFPQAQLFQIFLCGNERTFPRDVGNNPVTINTTPQTIAIYGIIFAKFFRSDLGI